MKPVLLLGLFATVAFAVDSQQAAPITARFDGSSSIDVGKSGKIHISHDGKPIAATAVKAEISTVGGKNVATVELTKADSAGLVYNLPLDALKESGFYTASISVTSQDKALAGLAKNVVNFKLVEEFAVSNLKVEIQDKSGASTFKSDSVPTFSKIGSVLEATHTNKLEFTVTLKKKSSGTAVNAHQVFLVFTHSSGAETIYTADKSADGTFVASINLAKAHQDFEGLSGKYTIRLVVGDFLMKTPIEWTFADLSLNIPAAPNKHIPKSHEINYEPLKEIVHQFRQPEKRPPAFVSDVFSIICLVPLGILFILWIRIGINFGNMPLSPWVLIFHGGLAALFGLYFVFWLQLDMFATLKYLAIVGFITFLAGNRLLRSIADKRKAKTD